MFFFNSKEASDAEEAAQAEEQERCNEAIRVEERAAIVADLRRAEADAESKRWLSVEFAHRAQAFRDAADRIDRGEHHRQRGGEGGDGRG